MPVVEESLLVGLTIGERPADRFEQWTALEDDAGRTVDIAQAFYAFSKPFPTEDESRHLAAGRIPLVSWNGTNTEAIVAGDHDELIRERAVALRDLGDRILLRWFWEMDGNNKADMAISPDAYVAAWMYLREIFAGVGAINVEWVWCPNAWAWEVGSPEPFYPGDANVDWICADGYN